MNTQQQALHMALELCTGLSLRLEEMRMDALALPLTQYALDKRVEIFNAYISRIVSFIEVAQQKEMI